jgi:low affinity Fe/Cu permease
MVGISSAIALAAIYSSSPSLFYLVYGMIAVWIVWSTIYFLCFWTAEPCVKRIWHPKGRDFQKALVLYRAKMSDGETHSDEEIKEWVEEDIFLIAKQNNTVWYVLVAAVLNGFVNIYAYALDDKPPGSVDIRGLQSKLVDKLSEILRARSDWHGLLVEVVDDESDKDIALRRLLDRYLDRWKIRSEVVTKLFVLPDFSHSRDPKNEKKVALLYAPTPFRQWPRLSCEDRRDKKLLIHSMYGIYIVTFPSEETYLANLEHRVLANNGLLDDVSQPC